MNLDDLLLKDDRMTEVMTARHALLDYVAQAIEFADEFPMAKHTPDAFFAAYLQSYPELADSGISVDDVKRGFALYLLSQDEAVIDIPDDWLLYDEVTFFMKELWY